MLTGHIDQGGLPFLVHDVDLDGSSRKSIVVVSGKHATKCNAMLESASVRPAEASWAGVANCVGHIDEWHVDLRNPFRHLLF